MVPYRSETGVSAAVVSEAVYDMAASNTSISTSFGRPEAPSGGGHQ